MAIQEMQEPWVLSLVQEDPLEDSMTIHSSILAWRIPRTDGPGGLQYIESQRVRHNRSDLAPTHSLKQRDISFLRLWPLRG